MDVLHGQIRSDDALLGDWEAQPVTGEAGNEDWEYRIDLEPDGLPERYTGLMRLPAGTDPIVVVAEVLKRAAEYR